MSMMVSFVLSFFPRDVLDEILNLIGSVSEGFPSYSYSNDEFELWFVYSGERFRASGPSCLIMASTSYHVSTPVTQRHPTRQRTTNATDINKQT